MLTPEPEPRSQPLSFTLLLSSFTKHRALHDCFPISAAFAVHLFLLRLLKSAREVSSVDSQLLAGCPRSAPCSGEQLVDIVFL